jgi:hypothetical protein
MSIAPARIAQGATQIMIWSFRKIATWHLRIHTSTNASADSEQEQDLMCTTFIRFALVAGTLLLSGNSANAIFCDAFATFAVENAQKVRQLGGCGLNLKDVSLSTNRAEQIRWCVDVRAETRDIRVSELQEQTNRCSGCQAYADVITAAAVDNIRYGCGFKNVDDERWRPDKAFHFNGCMAARDCDPVCVLFWCRQACLNFDGVKQTMLDPVAADVTQKIAECKLTHDPVSCRGCHGSNTSAAVLAVPKGWDAFQDAVKRLTPAKTSTKSGNDLSNPPDTSNRRATLPRGSNTSGNDLAKPSGEDSTSPTDTSRRRATAPKGGNTGAMDRLSGDSQLPNLGRPSSLPGEGNRRVPASGGASGVAKPVTNTPAPSMPTVDFGNCASCGKPPPTPPR